MTEGHLHDGGSSVDFTLTGKNICTPKAEYSANATGGSMAMRVEMDGMGGMRRRDGGHGEDETITHVERCEEGIPTKTGDKIRLTAKFDLDTIHSEYCLSYFFVPSSLTMACCILTLRTGGKTSRASG